MAYFGYADRLLLCYAPGIAYLYLVVAGHSGDARAAARVRLVVRNAVAAAVAIVVFVVARAMAIANRSKNMDIVRWKLVLLRGLLLLVVGLNAFSCLIALDIYLGGGGGSSAVARSACAVVAVAMYLRVWWVAVDVFGV